MVGGWVVSSIGALQSDSTPQLEIQVAEIETSTYEYVCCLHLCRAVGRHRTFTYLHSYFQEFMHVTGINTVHPRLAHARARSTQTDRENIEV